MPLRAILDGATVFPDEVTKDDYVICPECGDDMTIVEGYTRRETRIVRHFRHLVNKGCDGGESEIHLRMKYIVKSTLQSTFPEADVKAEMQFPKIGRRADVAATFDDQRPLIGKGIVVEAQHRNEGKAKLATTLGFVSMGYSVIWVEEEDFSESFNSVELNDVTYPFPLAVPHPHEWSTSVHQEFRRDARPEKYPIPATLPQEYLDEIESELYTEWRIGAKNYDFDVERRLSKNNANRSCVECGDAANWYLADFDLLSGFFCNAHHPALDEEEKNSSFDHR